MIMYNFLDNFFKSFQKDCIVFFKTKKPTEKNNKKQNKKVFILCFYAFFVFSKKILDLNKNHKKRLTPSVVLYLQNQVALRLARYSVSDRMCKWNQPLASATNP